MILGSSGSVLVHREIFQYHSEATFEFFKEDLSPLVQLNNSKVGP